MNSLRCVPLIAAVAMNLPSADAGEKAPDAKETVVLQRVAVPGTDREMGVGARQAVQYPRSALNGEGGGSHRPHPGSPAH